jgi:predicted GIY-YIG superfamily endonuclease
VSDINSIELLNNLIKDIKQTLENAPRYPMYSEDCYNNAPSKAGIYIIREEDGFIYIGETSNIKKRMMDLKQTRNHTFRRKVGKRFFSSDKDYSVADSKKRFSLTIEEKITEHCKNTYTISFVPLAIGRKEVEEYFLLDPNPPFFNSPKRRTSR